MRRWLALGFASVLAPAVAAAQASENAADDWGGPSEEEEENPDQPRKPGDISEIDIQDLMVVPVVEAASKRRQSLYEAPAAISTFKQVQILNADPTNPVEVLRRVPGAHVMQVNANTYFVGMRGWNGLLNTHVPVLLDGRRLTEGSLGYPPWGAFPVPLGEVDRIEVQRGPGATLYGVDAFSGVVSITTRDPIDHPGAEALVTSGVTVLPNVPDDDKEERVANYTSGYIAGTWVNDDKTLGLRASVGAHYVPEWVDTPQAGGSSTPVYRYGPMGVRGNLNFSARPDAKTRVRVTLSHVLTEIAETVTATGSRATLTSYSDSGATASVERRDLGLEGLSLRLQLDGTRHVKSNVSIDMAGDSHTGYRRFLNGHGLVQADWRAWEGRNVLTVGLEGSYRDGLIALGDGLPDQLPRAFYAAVFAQEEIKLLRKPDLILNVGIRLEQIKAKDPEDGSEATYRTASPRASLILRVAREHSLRVSAATGFRQPSLFEAFISETIPGFNPPFVVVAANPSLEPERVRSVELGYRGKPADWLRLDATLWVQQLRDIITTRTTNTPVILENNVDADQLGFELGAQMRWKPVSGYVSYGLVHHLTNEEERSVPSHIVALGADLQLGGGAYAGADGYITSSYQATLLEPQGSVNVIVRRQQDAMGILNLRLGRRFSEHVELFLHASNVIALFRSVEDLKQYPSVTSHPIGATGILGVRVEGL